MNQQFVDKITQKIPELKLFFDEPMKNHTTFRIGGTADIYVQPDDMQLKILLETARETDMPVTVIGNGSNLLVGDFGIRGLVIEIGKGMKDITISGKTITASAGAGLGTAASKAAEAGLCGMEFASGIPGNRVPETHWRPAAGASFHGHSRCRSVPCGLHRRQSQGRKRYRRDCRSSVRWE